MSKVMKLTLDRLKSLFRYDPDTGDFIKLTAKGRGGLGAVVGSYDKDGYLRVRIDKVTHKLHRLAYFYMKGEWPNDEIDHVDRNRSNNRWSNLRVASSSENKWNNSRKGGISGFPGVYPHGHGFTSKIKVKNKIIHLGQFDTAQDAYAAWKEAVIKYHGEFAKCLS